MLHLRAGLTFSEPLVAETTKVAWSDSDQRRKFRFIFVLGGSSNIQEWSVEKKCIDAFFLYSCTKDCLFKSGLSDALEVEDNKLEIHEVK